MNPIHIAVTHQASAALLIGSIPAPTAESCPCSELLSALVEKVETNYPGYHLEISGRPAEADYRLRLQRARSDAASAEPGIPCLKVLQTYRELKAGSAPRKILGLLMEDPDIDGSQFGILNLDGEYVGFSGAGNRHLLRDSGKRLGVE